MYYFDSEQYIEEGHMPAYMFSYQRSLPGHEPSEGYCRVTVPRTLQSEEDVRTAAMHIHKMESARLADALAENGIALPRGQTRECCGILSIKITEYTLAQ